MPTHEPLQHLESTFRHLCERPGMHGATPHQLEGAGLALLHAWEAIARNGKDASEWSRAWEAERGSQAVASGRTLADEPGAAPHERPFWPAANARLLKILMNVEVEMRRYHARMGVQSSSPERARALAIMDELADDWCTEDRFPRDWPPHLLEGFLEEHILTAEYLHLVPNERAMIVDHMLGVAECAAGGRTNVLLADSALRAVGARAVPPDYVGDRRRSGYERVIAGLVRIRDAINMNAGPHADL